MGTKCEDQSEYKDAEDILHGRVDIRNFSSSVENYLTSGGSERVKYFSCY